MTSSDLNTQLSICSTLLQALETYRATHPAYLHPTALNALETCSHRPDLIVNILSTALFQASRRQPLEDAVNTLIAQLFTPSFLCSPNYARLLQELGGHYSEQSPQDVEAIALLIDADHFRLNQAQENWVQNTLGGHLRVKAAFANWQSRKNLDQHYHARQYVLHHVPAGQDNVDGAMLLFGSELPHKHSEIHKIVICSNDKIFNNLVIRLNQTRIQVYKLTQNSQFLTLRDFRNQMTFEYAPSKLTQDLLKNNLQEIIASIQKEKGYYWIPLDAVSKRVDKMYGSELINIFERGVSTQQGVLNFLNKFPSLFAWHYLEGTAYVATFTLDTPQHAALAPAPDRPQTSSNASQSSNSDFVLRVYNLLQEYIPTPGTHRLIADVCQEYYKRFGCHLRDDLKGKGLGGTPRQFFERFPHYFTVKPFAGTNRTVAWVRN